MEGERYRDRLKIVKPTSTSNGRGGETIVQTLVAAVWVRVKNVSVGPEADRGGQLQPTAQYEVEIRYSARVANIDSTHKVLWRDKTLNVFAPVVSERKDFITMQCAEVGA